MEYVKQKMSKILKENGWMTNWNEENFVKINTFKNVQEKGGRTEYLGMPIEEAFKKYCKENNINPNILYDL